MFRSARLTQSVEWQALNLLAAGSSPASGFLFGLWPFFSVLKPPKPFFSVAESGGSLFFFSAVVEQKIVLVIKKKKKKKKKKKNYGGTGIRARVERITTANANHYTIPPDHDF